MPVGEWDPDAEEFRWFIRGLGIAEGTGDVIAEVDPDGTPHYYVANHRGDTVAVIDEDSVKEAEIEYDAFGNIIEQTGTFRPRFTFSTKEYLPEADLYLYAYRVYDPVAGRWTQRDPLDYYDSPNLYQFCGNSPVLSVDPNGMNRYIAHFDIAGFGGSGSTNLHVGIAVDSWERKGNEWVKTGVKTYHFGPKTLFGAILGGEGAVTPSEGMNLERAVNRVCRSSRSLSGTTTHS